jgi:hypothetical protein
MAKEKSSHKHKKGFWVLNCANSLSYEGTLETSWKIVENEMLCVEWCDLLQTQVLAVLGVVQLTWMKVNAIWETLLVYYAWNANAFYPTCKTSFSTAPKVSHASNIMVRKSLTSFQLFSWCYCIGLLISAGCKFKVIRECLSTCDCDCFSCQLISIWEWISLST